MPAIRDEIGYDLVRDLLSNLRPQQLFAGDVLCEQEDLLEDLYFIVSGSIEGLIDDLKAIVKKRFPAFEFSDDDGTENYVTEKVQPGMKQK